MSGRGKEFLCFRNVVRVSLPVRLGAAQGGGYHTGRDSSAPGHDRAQHRADVDGVVERLSHANIAERAARGVDGHVPEAKRRGGREKLALPGISLPAFARFIRNGKDVDVARLEFGGSGARFGNDARHQ